MHALHRAKVKPDEWFAFCSLAATGAYKRCQEKHKALEVASRRKPDEAVVVCLSGRGDKDAAEIARLRGVEF
jgi:tryptophan synthase beta subunit